MSGVFERAAAFTTQSKIIDISNGIEPANSANTVGLRTAGTGVVQTTAADSAFHDLTGVANSTSSIAVDNVSNTGSPLTSNLGGFGIYLLTANGSVQTTTGYLTQIGAWPSGFTSTQTGNICHNDYVYYGSVFTTSC
jgi:hypothetical protein